MADSACFACSLTRATNSLITPRPHPPAAMTSRRGVDVSLREPEYWANPGCCEPFLQGVEYVDSCLEMVASDQENGQALDKVVRVARRRIIAEQPGDEIAASSAKSSTPRPDR